MLNDWDMAIHADDLDKATPQVKPTVSARLLLDLLPFLINAKGTWQFISTRLLADGLQKHLPQDDFESFIWVTLYHGLRYLQHSKVGPILRSLIPYIFDSCIDLGDGKFFGGVEKFGLTNHWGCLSENFRFDCGPFDTWTKNALFAIREWRDFLHPPDTDVESEVFLIFPRPRRPPIDPEKVLLRDHKALGAFWRVTLSKDGWPSDDGAEDQLAAGGSTKRPRQDSDDAQPAQKGQKSGHFTPAATV